MPAVSLSHSPFYFFQTGSSVSLELTDAARLASRCIPGTFLPFLLQHWGYRLVLWHLAYVGAGGQSSGPHAYRVKALPTEPPLLALFLLILETILIIVWHSKLNPRSLWLTLLS